MTKVVVLHIGGKFNQTCKSPTRGKLIVGEWLFSRFSPNFNRFIFFQKRLFFSVNISKKFSKKIVSIH